MKGIMKVSRLNKSGLYISDLDWDKCFQGKNNPKGYFVMIIKPLEGWEKGIIYYEKGKNAFYGAQRSPFCFRTAAFRSQRPPIF